MLVFSLHNARKSRRALCRWESKTSDSGVIATLNLWWAAFFEGRDGGGYGLACSPPGTSTRRQPRTQCQRHRRRRHSRVFRERARPGDRHRVSPDHHRSDHLPARFGRARGAGPTLAALRQALRGQMRLVAPDATLFRMLEIIGLTSQFPTYPSMDAALPSPPAALSPVAWAERRSRRAPRDGTATS